jgi:ankyrin repeat protein
MLISVYYLLSGWTPLHEATNHGHFALAQLLIKHGANVNATGLDEVTPLHDAAISGNQKLVKLLVDKGANINLKNKKGKTPPDIAHPTLHNFFANLSSGELH